MSNFCEKCLSEPCCCIKKCSKCGVEKPLKSYHKDSRRLDGRYSSCKKCKASYYKQNKNSISKKRQEYRLQNKERIKEQEKRYRVKNKDAIRISHRKYRNKKYKKDLLFRLKKVLSSHLRKAVKNIGTKKDMRTLEALGCSLKELKGYLENLFTEGMSWDNYGEWHIDHIIPLASAKTEEDVWKLNHYTNLQPLWARENILKGDNLAWIIKE